VLLLLSALAGCGGLGSASPHHTITVVTTARLGSLDPWAPVSGQQDLLQRNVFQTLLAVGPDGGEPQNDLAESCRFSAPDAYTCRLKEAGFPDGTPVRPVDVAWTFVGRRGHASAVRGEAAELQSLIRSVESVDDHTFTLHLARPDASLPYLLTSPAAAIVRNGYDPSTTAVKGAVGTGAYRVESASATRGDVVLVANPHYSSAATVGNERVVIRHVADVGAGTAALTDGSADVFYPGNERESSGLTAAAGTEITRGAGLSTTVLSLDNLLPGDSATPVRLAVAALVDRNALARSAGGAVVPLFSVLPNDVQWSTGPDLEDNGPDPARAAELLHGAGVSTPVPLRLVKPSGLPAALWAELMRQLGAGGLFKPSVSETGGAAARLEARSPATSDPLAYLSLAGRLDSTAASSELVRRARSESDLAARERMVTGAEHQLTDRALAIPLWQGTAAVLTRPGVERVSVSPFLRLWLLRPPQ
jgi:peptide/nickel transport system substrate-binding protein